MRYLLFTFLLFLAWGGSQTKLLAQTGNPVFIFEISGKAKYAVPGEKKMKLEPGSVLPKGGELQLKQKSTVGIFYNDALVYLDGPLKISYDELLDSDEFRSSRVTTIFGLQMSYANLDGFTNKAYEQIEKSGFTGGSSLPPKKEKDGGGNKDRAVSIQEPLQGKLGEETVRFDWSLRAPNPEVQRFVFTLSDERGNSIFSQEVTGRNYTLNLTEAGAETGKIYRWSVDAIGYDDIDSGPLKIEYVGTEGFNFAKSRLLNDLSFQRASYISKLLMEAAFMEQFDYLQAAKEALDQAKEQSRRNPLVEKMYNAFIHKFDIK